MLLLLSPTDISLLFPQRYRAQKYFTVPHVLILRTIYCVFFCIYIYIYIYPLLSDYFQSTITIARSAPVKNERKEEKKIRHLINTRDTRKFYSVEGRSAKTKRGGVELINYSLITLHRDGKSRAGSAARERDCSRLISDYLAKISLKCCSCGNDIIRVRQGQLAVIKVGR